MRNNFVIRQVKEKDIEELCTLHKLIDKLEDAKCSGKLNCPSAEQRKSWYTKERLPGHHILLINGRIVSHIEVRDYPLNYYGIPVKCGELAGVFTHPDYQGRNLGLNLALYCSRYMKGKGFDISIVSSGTKSFYQSAGYSLYLSPSLKYTGYLKDLGKRLERKRDKVSNNIYQTGFFDAKKEADAVDRLYRNNIVTPPVSLQRQSFSNRWNFLRSDLKKGEVYYVAKRKEEVVAVLSTAPETYYAGDLLSVDIFVKSGESKAVIPLFQRMVTAFNNTPFSRVVVSSNYKNSVGIILQKRLQLGLHPHLQSFTMLKIINLKGLVDKLCPLWSERAKEQKNKFQGIIELECKGKIARIKVDKKRTFSLDKRKEPHFTASYINRLFNEPVEAYIYLPLSQRIFFSLLFGVLTSDDISLDKRYYLTEDKSAVVKTIFGILNK
jgi:GNAT superfamily N-acetyltransferase